MKIDLNRREEIDLVINKKKKNRKNPQEHEEIQPLQQSKRKLEEEEEITAFSRTSHQLQKAEGRSELGTMISSVRDHERRSLKP